MGLLMSSSKRTGSNILCFCSLETCFFKRPSQWMWLLRCRTWNQNKEPVMAKEPRELYRCMWKYLVQEQVGVLQRLSAAVWAEVSWQGWRSPQLSDRLQQKAQVKPYQVRKLEECCKELPGEYTSKVSDNSICYILTQWSLSTITSWHYPT